MALREGRKQELVAIDCMKDWLIKQTEENRYISKQWASNHYLVNVIFYPFQHKFVHYLLPTLIRHIEHWQQTLNKLEIPVPFWCKEFKGTIVQFLSYHPWTTPRQRICTLSWQWAWGQWGPAQPPAVSHTCWRCPPEPFKQRPPYIQQHIRITFSKNPFIFHDLHEWW